MHSHRVMAVANVVMDKAAMATAISINILSGRSRCKMYGCIRDLFADVG